MLGLERLMDTNTKNFVAFLPWILPIHIVAAYGLVAANYRGLVWAWESAYLPFLVMMALATIHSIVSTIFLFRLSWIGVWAFQSGLAVVMLYNTYLAMSQKRHMLLILIFALFTCSVLLLEKVKAVLRLPYYFSRRKWWESVPKGIPGIRAELSANGGNEWLPVRVTNLGKEGCFVFNEMGRINFVPKKIRVYRGNELIFDSDVRSCVSTDDRFGRGLQFDSSEGNLDWYKELKDHLNSFGRSGYEYS